MNRDGLPGWFQRNECEKACVEPLPVINEQSKSSFSLAKEEFIVC